MNFIIAPDEPLPPKIAKLLQDYIATHGKPPQLIGVEVSGEEVEIEEFEFEEEE